MKREIHRLCAILLLPFMMLLNCPLTAIGSEVPLAIEINHDPIEEATAGERIGIEAEITDESGIRVARVYFKATEAADYNFVVLVPAGGNVYTATLPAPANGVTSIEYLILVQNGNKQVVKTQTYQVAVKDNDAAPEAVAGNGKIHVYTELKQVPTEITGFSDNIVIDAVESAAKLGVVAGLYSASTAGASTGDAVAVGTVTASSGGISTTAVVVGSVAAAAAVGGVAVAASSSSDDNDNTGDGGGVGSCPYYGTWAGTHSGIDCNGQSFQSTWNGTVNTACYFSIVTEAGNGLQGSIDPNNGSANLTGHDNCGPLSGSATFGTSTVSGTFSGSGTSGSFTGNKL